MSLDFSLIDRDILDGVADAIRYVDGTSAGIAPKDFAARVRELKYPKPTWLYFTMPHGGTVTLTKNGTPTEVTLEYSLDNGSTWTEWVETNNVRSLVLIAGQTMHVRNTSETSTGFSTSSSNYYNFAFTADTYVGGNTDSLLCKTPNNAVIVRYCYYSLFFGCRYLLTAPQLPSTTIDVGCYRGMFQNCLELRTAPELPALVMKDDAYVNMFYQCISLTTPPQLPATKLANFCYQSMFQKCSSLTAPPQLPATKLAIFCYRNMFYQCSSLVIPVDFILPATTLEDNSYASMFYGCINVNLMRTSMTDISATGCLTNWLGSVSSTGDLYCPAELTIPTGASGIPSGWTRHDI